MSRPVTDIIREINGGQWAEEITEQAAKLVKTCRETGKPGTVSIKLKFKPGRAGSAAFEVIPTYEIKSPTFDTPTEIFFGTVNGALVRTNPDQGKLELVDVSLPVTQAGQVPLRDVVNLATGEVHRLPLHQTLDPKTGDVIAVPPQQPPAANGAA